MGRKSRVLLAASLLLNIFAVGAIGGGLVMIARPAVWRSITGASGRPIRAAGDVLPQPERQQFRRMMTGVLRDNRDLEQTAADNRAAAAELFVQPQFDRDAVAAALERARDADILLRSRLETTAVDFAARLPAGERELLADALQRRGTLRQPHRAGAGRQPAQTGGDQ